MNWSEPLSIGTILFDDLRKIENFKGYLKKIRISIERDIKFSWNVNVLLQSHESCGKNVYIYFNNTKKKRV